jgi:hydrogenase/urease accessory protein HupE
MVTVSEAGFDRRVSQTAARRWAVSAIAALCLALAAPVSAHPVPFSYIVIRAQPDALDLTLVAHAYDVAYELGMKPATNVPDLSAIMARSSELVAVLGQRLAITADGRALQAAWAAPEPVPERDSVRLRAHYALTGLPGRVDIATVMFPYDPVHKTFVNIYEGDTVTAQAILDKDRTRFEYFTGTRQGSLAVLQKFVPSGVHHILIGPDHLLFLIGLMLLGGTIRQLLLVVTAFTIAHSITLSLAALNVVMPPAGLIEPAIALSVVYVGADNLLMQEGRDMRAWTAFAFGLIHGFGFANVLRDMDLPSRALGWSLFGFNVGVEIGQLLVVVLVATALGWIRARSAVVSRRLVLVGSVVVMLAGAFWFVQRVFFSGGTA